ncbi:MAG: hypothetical protein R3B82_24735 [Sandaracinaceae bacterium]
MKWPSPAPCVSHAFSRRRSIASDDPSSRVTSATYGKSLWVVVAPPVINHAASS